MYFDMSASTLNKITHLKNEISRSTGIHLDLTSDSLFEEIFNTIYAEDLNQVAGVARELLMDLKEHNPKRKHQKVLSQYDNYFVLSNSAKAA